MSIEPLTARLVTRAALRTVPDHQIGEILEGELVVSPRPASLHANAAAELGGALIGPFKHGKGGPGGWVLLYEPELHLGPREDALVPDLAGWRRARMTELPDVAAFTLVPDWVCEVLSPSTERNDRVRKARIYAREGVQVLWFVNPRTFTVEVLTRAGGGWQTADVVQGDALVRIEPFDAVEIDLGMLWSR